MGALLQLFAGHRPSTGRACTCTVDFAGVGNPSVACASRRGAVRAKVANRADNLCSDCLSVDVSVCDRAGEREPFVCYSVDDKRKCVVAEPVGDGEERRR